MELTTVARENLRKGAVWARFFAIACFVILGLSALGMVLAGIIINGFDDRWIAPLGDDFFELVSVIYMTFTSVLIVLCAVPAMFLLCFSKRAKRAVDLGDEAVLEQSMGSLRRYFVFSGVAVAVYMLMSALGVLTSFFWAINVGLANM